MKSMQFNSLKVTYRALVCILPVVQAVMTSGAIVTSSISDAALIQTCNLDNLANQQRSLSIQDSMSSDLANCLRNIQYRCSGDQSYCFYSWDLVFSNSINFKSVGDSCPAWKKGIRSAECRSACNQFTNLTAQAFARALAVGVLSCPNAAPCYQINGVICNYDGYQTNLLGLPPAPGIKISNTSSYQLADYLKRAINSPTVIKKRTIVGQLTSPDPSTQAYLNTCNLGTASTSNEFLTGCLAGLVRYCKQSGSLSSCHDYFETVYFKSIYAPLVTCLPWKSNPFSDACFQAVGQVCNQYGPFLPNGTPDQGAGVCGFATYSQKSVFANSAYCPQF